LEDYLEVHGGYRHHEHFQDLVKNIWKQMRVPLTSRKHSGFGEKYLEAYGNLEFVPDLVTEF
jgi:hypothetical protein